MDWLQSVSEKCRQSLEGRYEIPSGILPGARAEWLLLTRERPSGRTFLPVGGYRVVSPHPVRAPSGCCYLWWGIIPYGQVRALSGCRYPALASLVRAPSGSCYPGAGAAGGGERLTLPPGGEGGNTKAGKPG